MTLGDPTPPPAVPASPPVLESHPVGLMTEPAVPPRPRPRKPVHEAREAALETHAPRERVIDPDQLIGLSPPDVRKLMGTPSEVKDDHLSRQWVYTAPGCNFRVFFYPDLNAAAFHALKYGGSDSNGGTLASSNACVRRILTARANAPG